MASIDPKVAQTLMDSSESMEFWLVGFDAGHVVYAIPCTCSKKQASGFLPGGLRVIGKFLASSDLNFLEICKEIELSPAVFMIKSDSKLKYYYVDPPISTHKELSHKQSPPFVTIYSKSVLPIFSLENPDFWFINRSALFKMNSQYFSFGDPASWNALIPKPLSQAKLEILYELTSESEDFAPSVEVMPYSQSYSIEISWASVVLESTSVTEALDYHLSKLRDLANFVIENLKKSPEKSAAIFCFSNIYLKFPIIIPYFYSDWDENSVELLDQRKFIHELFSLPPDWPLVRSSCNIRENNWFKNVHLPLLEPKPSDVGVKSAIKGHCAYFHYAQDSFDDKGWGCAYRSLQTIISWLSEQNLFSGEIPSHFHIQKLLVEAGDKPKEFVGSKEWIGAFEVMLILDVYCKISCKILNLSSGKEFTSKGRELANHFATEGSPIMIGGGVLAYTLLGVDYNEDTGECKYLILDPHYVGPDNQQTVLQKGWCGWKSLDIFRNDCFYNLCMPQRPRYI